MKKGFLKMMGLVLLLVMLIPADAFAWTADNGDGTFSNPLMFGDYPDNDVIRVGDTYYMSSTSMHLFPACPIMSSKDLVNWSYESYAFSEEDAKRLAKEGDDGLTLKNGKSVYDMGPWATSLRYSERLKKFYLLVNMQDGVEAEYAVLCVADQASGPWKAYRLDNPQGAIKGLYDPGLLFDRDPKTGEENGDIWVVHGQGRLYVSRLNVVDEKTGELAIDPQERNIEIYNYTGGAYNEGAHAYKLGDTYYIISTPTWSGTPSKKSIAIQTKDLQKGPYEVKDIMRSYMNFGENGIHQGGIVDVPQKDGTSEWWSVIFQDRNKLGRVPTLQPVYWEEEDGLKWPMMGVRGQNGEQAVVTMEKPHTGAVSEPSPPADSDEFDSDVLGLHWQWNHVSDQEKWSLTERPGYMRLYTATVTESLTTAQNTLRQRVVGPESAATIKLDISHMADGDIAGLSVIQRDYNYIGVTLEGVQKRIMVKDKEQEQISVSIPADSKEIWFRASMPRFEYRVEFFYSLDGENFTQLGGKYEMHYGNYVGMGFGAFNYATKALGGFVDMDYFHMDIPDNQGNYHKLNEKIEAESYDAQSYDASLGEPSREYNLLTRWTADYVYTDALNNWGTGYDLAVGNLQDGNWVSYNRVDLGAGAEWFNIRVSATADDGRIEVRLADEKGELLAEAKVPNTGNLEAFQNVIVPLKETAPDGIQKICLVYKGAAKSCQFNWFMFGTGEKPELPEAPKELQAENLAEGQIRFSWTENPGVSYDLKLGDKVVSNVHSPFTETGLQEGTVYKACVRAKNYGGYSEWSDGIKAAAAGNPYCIPQSSIAIPAFSSEEAGGEGDRSGYISAILDGDENTFWHSAWSSGNAQPPHWFILDLGGSYEINRVTMLPRQGSGALPNGLIKKVTISGSNTGMEDGNFSVLLNQKQLPEGTTLVSLEFEAATVRYLKVFIDESHNDFASLGEINVYRKTADETKPGMPQSLNGQVNRTAEGASVLLSWDKAEDPESGIAGYSIYRDGKFLDVTKGLAYTDRTVEEGKTYRYQVSAFNGAGLDGEPALHEIDVPKQQQFYRIPQENMKASASSEETVDEPNTKHGFAKNVLDNDPDTFWCVQWSDKNPEGKHPGPHWLQIDLGKTYPLYSVHFMQRNLSSPHGQVIEYAVSYSEDGQNFMVAEENGVWSLENQENTVFMEGISARYIRLDCKKGQGSYVPAAMAEVNVYAIDAGSDEGDKDDKDDGDDKDNKGDEDNKDSEDEDNKGGEDDDNKEDKADIGNKDDKKDPEGGTGTTPPTTEQNTAPELGRLYESEGIGYKITSLKNMTAQAAVCKDKSLSAVKLRDTVVLAGEKFKVTSIASSAFKNNRKITSVQIGKNVKSIGSNAFSGCTRLSRLTLGANVKIIGKKAFYGCVKLKSITIKTKKLTRKNIGSKAFQKIFSKAVFKVPKAKVKSYQSLFREKGVSKKAKIKK